MKFICDAHISEKLVKFLEKNNCEAIHVKNILSGLRTRDEIISAHADENDFIVITKDSDFSDSHFIKHSPRKLIKISLANISNEELINIFETNLLLIKKVFERNEGYIEIRKDSIIYNIL